MAALDPTQFEPFYKLFPELTAAQTQAILLMAIGLPGKDISQVKGYSTSRYSTLVEEAKERLQVPTTGVLRTAVHLRVILAVVGSALCP